MIDLLTAGKQDVPPDQVKQVRDVITSHCTKDAWSAELRQCLVDMHSVNDADALDQTIELPPNQQAVARVVLTNRLTEVNGTVTAADAITTREIVVFPENSARLGHRSRHIRRVEADARGGFRIIGLPPGERYLAYATDYLDEGEHLDPEFLTSIRNLAVAFPLEEAEKRTLQLNVVER